MNTKLSNAGGKIKSIKGVIKQIINSSQYDIILGQIVLSIYSKFISSAQLLSFIVNIYNSAQLQCNR